MGSLWPRTQSVATVQSLGGRVAGPVRSVPTETRGIRVAGKSAASLRLGAHQGLGVARELLAAWIGRRYRGGCLGARVAQSLPGESASERAAHERRGQMSGTVRVLAARRRQFPCHQPTCLDGAPAPLYPLAVSPSHFEVRSFAAAAWSSAPNEQGYRHLTTRTNPRCLPGACRRPPWAES